MEQENAAFPEKFSEVQDSLSDGLFVVTRLWLYVYKYFSCVVIRNGRWLGSSLRVYFVKGS